jgi:hypothetical protein
VGQASSEQQALKALDPEGPNGHAPTPPTEAESALGEEELPPGDEPPRAKPS